MIGHRGSQRALAAVVVFLLTGTNIAGAGEDEKTETSVAIDSVMTHRFAGWMAGFRERAGNGDIRSETLYTALAGLRPDPDVLRYSQNQPEHTRTTGDYVTRAVSHARIASGREKLAEFSETLIEIEKTYGVPRYVLVAIWGLESNYGSGQGSRRVLRSLATLAAFDARRGVFWEEQLLAALRMVQNGDKTADGMSGSWAGAMGHTQFIPTTFLEFAVDHNGDGKRDIWGTEADALATAANYLKESGWIADAAWGWEVVVPDGYDYAQSGLGVFQPVTAFSTAGVRRIDGVPLPDDLADVSLLVPQSARGPAFLVTPNFRAILEYNRSVSYALAVLHLADRLQGRGTFQRAWPDVVPLNREQRMALQELLVARGYDTGGIDGILGRNSVAAIRAVQRGWGVPEDGFADLPLLTRLQQESKDVAATVAGVSSGSAD